MVEQFGYPYIAGQYGVDFTQLKENTINQQIKGGTGRELLCWISDRRVEIRDAEDILFSMSAVVKEATLHFTLRTEDKASELKRQKDLRARRFVDFAFAYFEARGVRIDTFEGEWHKDSVNYKAFQEMTRETGDDLFSAANTWTGKAMRQHGFTPTKVIRKRGVGHFNPTYMLVRFKKAQATSA